MAQHAHSQSLKHTRATYACAATLRRYDCDSFYDRDRVLRSFLLWLFSEHEIAPFTTRTRLVVIFRHVLENQGWV